MHDNDTVSFFKASNIKANHVKLVKARYGRRMNMDVITSDGLERSNRAINKVQIIRLTGK